MTPTRVKVLKNYLFNNNNGVSFKELLSYFFDKPYYVKANRFLEKIEVNGVYKKVKFRHIDKPLYFPKSFPLSSLRMVMVESFYPGNWHYYEIPETTVTPDDIVVDCGAAEGMFGLKVHNRCKKIYMIEPLKKFVDTLHKTFDNCGNVEIIPVAVSDQKGFSAIENSDIASSITPVNTNGTTVEVATLDDLFFSKNIPVTYLKLDVEGFDAKALYGARDLIRSNKPKIAVTTYHAKSHASEIAAYLKEIVPDYNIVTKGIFQDTGSPVMLHAWCD